MRKVAHRAAVWASALAVVGAFLIVVSACSHAARLVARKEGVLLVAPDSAGWVGWCLRTTAEASGDCGGYVRSRPPVVAESWSSGSVDGSPGVARGIAVTTSAVTAVSVDGGAAVATRPEATLPFRGGRTVIVEVHEKHTADQEPLPRFTPLGAKGQRVAEATQPVTLTDYIGRRRASDPSAPTNGVCRIRAKAAPGLVAASGEVVTHVRGYGGLLGDAMLSCASTTYNVDGNTLVITALLDASAPGATPGNLPATAPVRGHPGIVTGPGVTGEILARRTPGAWLMVGGGGTTSGARQQRLDLLEHARLAVDL
jgi:hypothetical protein